MKTKIIPFNKELAEKIQAGETKGRIVTSSKKEVTIIKTDALGDFPIVGLVQEYSSLEIAYSFSVKGVESKNVYVLSIELPEEAPEHKFKPFDKVLVRHSDKSEWRPRLYSRKGNVGYCMQDGLEYMQILPYEGNENLVGTTDKPKKE